MFGMGTWNRLAKGLLIPTMLLLFMPAAFAQNEEVVATLMRTEGAVQVLPAKAQAPVKGRNGLLLKAGDTVVTDKEARATIKFRDGSEIRLFPNTNFLVESKEAEGGERFFKLNLFMKAGGIWGNFVKQKQIAQIGSPTATIGIKGTTLRLTDRDGQARVALTEGLIEVKNDRSTVEVQPGKRLSSFSRSDELSKKLEDIPYRLDMQSEKQQLAFEAGKAEEVYINVQLVDIKSGAAVTRPGLVYLRSNYDRITYPAKVSLDARGFARVALKIAPPEAIDAALNGSVYVWAVIDQEDADDTSEGRILFKIPVPAGKERVKVDSKTGTTKKSP